jgi:sugar transferase (PEP-CTERM/EpsH1 system associated)
MKKVLILSSRVPYPLVGGDRIRVYNMSRIIATKYQADLLAINESGAKREDIKVLEETFNELFLFDFGPMTLKLNALKKLLSRKPIQVEGYYFPAIQKWIDGHWKEYDLIYCNHVRTAEYVRNLPCRKVLDFVDAISMNYKTALSRAKGFWKAFYFIEEKRLLPYELRVLRSFDKSFVTSPVDRRYLLGHASGPASLEVIPNGVNNRAVEWSKSVKEENWISFLGKMDYYPNEDAVIYFAKEVFPLLSKAIHNMKFIIVGAYPTKKVQQLKRIPGVEVTGFVDDPYEYLAKSKVVVAPMRFGAGIQNKILEAMALKKAVVTTSVGAGGVQGEDGSHFVIADTPREMSERILELIRDEHKRIVLGENARVLIEHEYTWNIVGRKLLEELSEVI